MKTMDNKAQITWFIIIGIVAIFIAGLFFYYVKNLATTDPEPEVQGIEPINDFIVNCIDQQAIKALNLVGRQGGYIFKRQGGLVVDFRDDFEGKLFIEHEDEKTGTQYDVAYAIRRRRTSHGIYMTEPWQYPWIGFEIPPPENAKGVFGDSDLPVLYKAEGPFSVQAQIETYITNKIGGCLDLSIFQDYEITAPEVSEALKTKVTIAKNDVLITVEYPIQIRSGSEIWNLDEFSLKKDVQLKQVYEFSENLIKLDNTDITFNIVQALGSIHSQRKENVFGHDDIIIVKDPESLLGSGIFEFWFARQNRPPAHNPAGSHKDPDEDKLTPTHGGNTVTDQEYTDYQPVAS